MSNKNNVSRNGGNVTKDASVVGNLKLEDTPKVYRVTTSDVEAFLQSRINEFISAARENEKKRVADLQEKENAAAAAENRDAKKIYQRDIPDVNIILRSVEVSSKYVPFFLFLPEEALKSNDGKKNERVMSIFNNPDASNVGEFRNEIMAAIGGFFYNKDDKKMIRSNEFKSRYHISARSANNIANLMSPRSKRVNGKNYVIVVIDGIRLFSYMARDIERRDVDNNGNPRYFVDISDIKKINDCEYRYTVTKTMRGKDKKRGGIDFNKIIKDAVTR